MDKKDILVIVVAFGLVVGAGAFLAYTDGGDNVAGEAFKSSSARTSTSMSSTQTSQIRSYNNLMSGDLSYYELLEIQNTASDYLDSDLGGKELTEMLDGLLDQITDVAGTNGVNACVCSEWPAGSGCYCDPAGCGTC